MGPVGETSRARRCRTRPTSASPFASPSPPQPVPRNMSLIVKICGLSTRETLDVALDAGRGHGGFVFFPPSPRHLGLEAARDLGKQAGRRAKRLRSPSMPTMRRLPISSRRCSPIFAAARQGNRGAAARHQAEIRAASDEGDCGGGSSRSRITARLRGRGRSHPVRCPRTKGRNATRRSLARCSTGMCSRISISNCRSWSRAASTPAMSRSRSCRPAPAASMFLGRGAHAGREGSRDDPRLHSRRARFPRVDGSDESKFTQFLPQRPRRNRTFRYFRRTFCCGNADAADPRPGEGLRRRQGRSGVQCGNERLPQGLCRPAVAAVSGRTPH